MGVTFAEGVQIVVAWFAEHYIVRAILINVILGAHAIEVNGETYRAIGYQKRPTATER